VFESRLIIDGVAGPAPGGRTYEHRDPSTGSLVTRAAACTPEDARKAANAAAAAFPIWSQMSAADRAAVLRRAAILLDERKAQICEIAAEEVGSSPDWTLFNIEVARDILEEAANAAPYADEAIPATSKPDCEYRLTRRPAGVVLGIAPWNAAVTLSVRAVAVPLACGNTVILKASELCPKTHESIALALNDAGLPPGALNFITNAPDDAEAVVEALIGHPAVRRVNFTGSTRVGREIAVVAARHLKPCLLELSGKAAMIVLKDADLDEAARAAAFSAFFNLGQICMSTDRVIVEESVADAFTEKLLEQTRALTDGPGRNRLGKLISQDAAQRIRAMIDDAVAKGAHLLIGGDVFDDMMHPAVLDGVSSAMRVYSEEVFGPVVGLIRVSDAEEAVTVANDSIFGLVTSVFSHNYDCASTLARRLETGICHINGATVRDDPSMPFGGVKASGYGRFGGRFAVHEFTEIQWVSIQHSKPDYPI